MSLGSEDDKYVLPNVPMLVSSLPWLHKIGICENTGNFGNRKLGKKSKISGKVEKFFKTWSIKNNFVNFKSFLESRNLFTNFVSFQTLIFQFYRKNQTIIKQIYEFFNFFKKISAQLSKICDFFQFYGEKFRQISKNSLFFNFIQKFMTFFLNFIIKIRKLSKKFPILSILSKNHNFPPIFLVFGFPN
jgi:hypothetical protein